MSLGEWAVIADTHFRPGPKLPLFAKSWAEGIANLASRGIRHLVVGGDLFDSHKIWKGGHNDPSPVVEAIACPLADFDMHLHLVTGNHDMNTLGESAFRVFASHGRVSLMGPGESIYPLHWQWGKRPERGDYNDQPFVVGHLALIGGRTKAGGDGVTEDDLPSSEFRATRDELKSLFPEAQILLGHFHLAQAYGNVQYLGSPWALGWNEEGYSHPGAFHFSTGERLPFNGPKYRRITCTGEQDVEAALEHWSPDEVLLVSAKGFRISQQARKHAREMVHEVEQANGGPVWGEISFHEEVFRKEGRVSRPSFTHHALSDEELLNMWVEHQALPPSEQVLADARTVLKGEEVK